LKGIFSQPRIRHYYLLSESIFRLLDKYHQLLVKYSRIKKRNMCAEQNNAPVATCTWTRTQIEKESYEQLQLVMSVLKAGWFDKHVFLNECIDGPLDKAECPIYVRLCFALGNVKDSKTEHEMTPYTWLFCIFTNRVWREVSVEGHT